MVLGSHILQHEFWYKLYYTNKGNTIQILGRVPTECIVMIYDIQTKKCWHRNQKLIDRLNNRTAELVRKRQETAAAEKAAKEAAAAQARGPAEAEALPDDPKWTASTAFGATPKRMPQPTALPRDIRQIPAQQVDPDAARVVNK